MADDNNGNVADGGDDTGNTGGEGGEDKKFTQADVERIIDKRTARHKSEVEKLTGQISELGEKLKGLTEKGQDKGGESGKGGEGDKGNKPLTADDVKAMISDSIKESMTQVLSAVDSRQERERLLSGEGKDLLPTYKELVKGSTKEELQESLEAAIKRQKDEVGEINSGNDKSFGKGNADASSTGTKFKQSEIEDPAFYEKNKDAIRAAMKRGDIINDK